MHERPEFSFERPFTVSRPGGFTCNGRRYQSGDEFDWRALGLSEAEVWDLWVLCQVDNVPGMIAAPAAPELERCSDAIAAPALVDTAAPSQDAAPTRDATPTVAPDAPPMRPVALPRATASPAPASIAGPGPSPPPKAIAARGVTKPPQQNTLPRR
jgi:hypothetical protein